MNVTTLETLTAKQVAEILHTSEAGLAQMRYRGIGPKFIKAGPRKVIYTRRHVEEYLAANTCQRTDDPRGAA
ncbi:MAG: helix-turn-helix domain-containing protein [Mycobacterium sp.]|nr:helix-turn-helix domain-containing protein [Mycobacterium sp.]